jgi:hypothetical protein
MEPCRLPTIIESNSRCFRFKQRVIRSECQNQFNPASGQGWPERGFVARSDIAADQQEQTILTNNRITQGSKFTRGNWERLGGDKVFSLVKRFFSEKKRFWGSGAHAPERSLKELLLSFQCPFMVL